MPVQVHLRSVPGALPADRLVGRAEGHQSIAIVVDDSDAPISPYVYWIVFDIQPGTPGILEGELPPGAKQARGSAGTTGTTRRAPARRGTATGSPCMP